MIKFTISEQLKLLGQSIIKQSASKSIFRKIKIPMKYYKKKKKKKRNLGFQASHKLAGIRYLVFP